MMTRVDDHGVKEYKTFFLLAVTISCMVITVVGGGWLMYVTEGGAGNANVSTWRDGIWVVTMTMTTIGFGDYYPVTDGGRTLGWIVFVLGALEIGALIGIISSSLGADKSIQNRELRTMLCEVMRKLEHLEHHLKVPVSVTKDSHLLDIVFQQRPYNSARMHNGWLTIGKDSTGIYMMSVCAYDNETGQEIHRWLPAVSRNDLDQMFKRLLENDNEL